MLDIDLEVPADVLVVPTRPDEADISTAQRHVSLRSAIQYVMELMPSDAKPRAVIRTRSGALGLGEIAAIYGEPSFPRL